MFKHRKWDPNIRCYKLRLRQKWQQCKIPMTTYTILNYNITMNNIRGEVYHEQRYSNKDVKKFA